VTQMSFGRFDLKRSALDYAHGPQLNSCLTEIVGLALCV
jgi:hypothetical protein